jgi:hypothetical protein
VVPRELAAAGPFEPLVLLTAAARLRTLIRHNIAFSILFTIGTAVRVAVSLAYQPALLLQRDTYTYLNLALDPGFEGFRPGVYPLILKGLLPFENLIVVTTLQHVAGLGIGLLLYLLLRRLKVGPSLAAMGVAPVLLDAYQIDIEQFILTEAFFETFIVAAVALLVWKTQPSLLAVAGSGLLLALSGLTRFVGLGLIVVAVVYILLRRLGWTHVLALLLGFVLPYAAFTTFQGNEGAGLTSRNGFFLYGRVSSFADCRGIELRPELERLCFDTPPSERGPSYGFYELELPRFESKQRGNALLLEFSRKMIRNQPLDYARVVTTDTLRSFHWEAPLDREPFVKRWRFVRSVGEADPVRFVRVRDANPPSELGLTQRFRINRPLADRLLTYQDYVYTYGPLIALLIVLGGIGSILGLRSDPRNLRAESALFTLGALVLLILPVAATVWHFRYLLPSLPLAGPAGALGATVLRDRLVRPSDEDLEI